MPSSGMKPWTALRIAQSPQPGHQRTSWSDLKSFAFSWISSPTPRPPSSVAGASCLDQRRDRLGQLARAERQAADAVVADGVDEELGPDQLQQLPGVHLGDEHL